MSRAKENVVGGFRFSGVEAGIKKRGGLDLALAVADKPVSTAAIYTVNRVKAAPVLLAEERTKAARMQAILANSGCANACTGKPGMQAAEKTSAHVAKMLQIEPKLVLPASTGVIGQLLPADKVIAASKALIAGLSPDPTTFSQAILTTDRGPKVSKVSLRIAGENVTVYGVAKGAGMIHPNMATTLAFVFTDANIGAPLLRRVLKASADETFNAISVDGDTSTNDTLSIMASGAAKHPALGPDDKDTLRFTDALVDVLSELGDLIVADGEGAEHLVRIAVSGADSVDDARKVAKAVATSNLVKTALHGKDPNWGRILAAAGMADVEFDPDAVEIRIGDVPIVKRGVAVGAEAEKQANAIMKSATYTIHLKLGPGAALQAQYTTCDLGHEYVRINADYRS